MSGRRTADKSASTASGVRLDDLEVPDIVDITTRFKRADEQKTPIRSRRPAEQWERRGKQCPHRTYVLDEDRHTVECEDCGDRLDAFWVLKEMSRWYRERDYRWEEVKEHRRREAIAYQSYLFRIESGVYETVAVLIDARRQAVYRVEEERDGRWAVLYLGGLIRREAKLERARQFVRRHVQALYGKEANRDAAVRAAKYIVTDYGPRQCGHRYREPGKARLSRCPNVATGLVNRKWRCPEHGGPTSADKSASSSALGEAGMEDVSAV